MRGRAAGAFVLSLAGLAALGTAGVCAADEPYAKKGTWVDTMMAAREAMARESGAKPPAPRPLPDFGTGRYTVTAWIRTRSEGTVFARAPRRGEWVPQGKSLFVGDGRLVFDVGWVGDVEARKRVADGRWHHVALVSVGPRRRLYVDGKLSGDGELEAKGDPKDWPLKVGQTSTDFGGPFRGSIDEFRVYARAMSAEQIRASLTKPSAEALVLHWPFEGDCSDASGSRNPAGRTTRCAYDTGKVGKALKLDGGGGATLSPGGMDRAGVLWSRLAKDFASDAARKEMAWEREDGIWGTDFGAISYPAVAARYAKATRYPTGAAERAARLAASARTVADVKAVRELYLRSRGRGEMLDRISQFRLKELRAAVITVYGVGAERGKLLARLDELEGRALAWKDVPAGEALADWTSAVSRLRRDVLLDENPLLGTDKLLFVKRQTYHSSHFYTDFIDGCGRYGGNLCVLNLETGEVTDLVPEMKEGIFGRFDLHFSARKVVFGWKKAPREGFRLYEMDIDPRAGRRLGKVRQLTFPPDDEAARIRKYDNSFLGGTGRMYYHQTDDMHPCYLPDGGICFTSTRCEYGTLCDAPDTLSTTVLYRIDGDGKNMEKLTNSPVSEFSPSMMADGRILYARWEYVDKGQLGIKCLWAMRPDGTNSVEVYGNDIQYPPTLLHGREIPGQSNLFVVLGTPHYPQSGIGTVIRLDMSREIRTREPMTYITPHVDIRQEGGWNHRLPDGRWVRHTRGPLYMDPYPLSREVFLVAHNPDRPWNDPRAYGLYVIDEAGNHVQIHTDEEFSCWQPVPLRARPTPPVLPGTGDPELAKKGLAVCMVQDIYHGMAGVERGSVRYIRVMEQLPRPWAARRFWDPRGRYGSHTALVSRGSVLAVKVLHGVVPVHEDGSAHFCVPADRNIYFQALDKDFMEIQRERTYVNYRPGERRACVGCHETPRDSLPQRHAITLARQVPAAMPGPQPGDKEARRPIHYTTDVQPVLDRHCVRCHGASRPKGGLDLTGALTTRFCRSYENILRRGLVKTFDEGSDWGGTDYAPPKSVGCYASRFIRQVRKGCPGNDGKLPLADFVRLATWVDSNAQYYGTYYGRKNIRYRGHPDFRPVPTFAEAVSTEAPTRTGGR